MTASQAGVLATNNVTFDSSWTFGQAFFFVGTLVTTVGRWVLFCGYLERSVKSMSDEATIDEFPLMQMAIKYSKGRNFFVYHYFGHGKLNYIKLPAYL